MGRRFITLLAILSLVLTACGDSAQDTLDDVTTTQPSAPTEATTTGPPATTTAAPATTADAAAEPARQLDVDRTNFLGEPLSAEEVETLVTEFDAAVAALVAADNSHDPDLVPGVFTADVAVEDGDDGFVGIEKLMNTYRNVWSLSSKSQVRHTGTYIGLRGDWPVDGVAVLESVDYLGYTADEPMIEYRHMGIDNGAIASWTSFYDPDTRPFFTPVEELDAAAAEMLESYATAWSSGDYATVSGLYDPDAIRNDTCLHSAGSGRDAIESTAAGMFDLHPDIEFELLRPVATRNHDSVEAGGIFAIHTTDSDGQACELEALVLLDADGGSIESEEIYYDAESLIECGWSS